MVQRIGHRRLQQLESVFIPLYEMTIVLWNTMVFLLVLIEVELVLFLLLEELLVAVEAFLLFLAGAIFVVFNLFVVIRKVFWWYWNSLVRSSLRQQLFSRRCRTCCLKSMEGGIPSLPWLCGSPVAESSGIF